MRSFLVCNYRCFKTFKVTAKGFSYTSEQQPHITMCNQPYFALTPEQLLLCINSKLAQLA